MSRKDSDPGCRNSYISDKSFPETTVDNLEGLQHIINQRGHGVQKEYLCIFNDERSERLPVPAENEVLVTYSELDATKLPKAQNILTT